MVLCKVDLVLADTIIIDSLYFSSFNLLRWWKNYGDGGSSRCLRWRQCRRRC